MAELIVIYSPDIDLKWLDWIKDAIASSGETVSYQSTIETLQMKTLSHKKMLFLCDLNEIGRDLGTDTLILEWKRRQIGLEGVSAAMVCRSKTDCHTKTYARSVFFLLNGLGVTIIAKPLIEILPNFENFETWKKSSSLELEEIAFSKISDLTQRLSQYAKIKLLNPKLLMIHSSNINTSNTFGLWKLVLASLKEECINCKIDDIHIKRGSITDCIGCNFELCVSQAKQLSCVVGGQYVEEIMPAMAEADVIFFLCPNYNDTIGADLISLINRMSGFYRTQDLSLKRIYAIIISGNSGTDAVANQLIGSLNMNKGFVLPPRFCLTQIANDPLSVLEKEHIVDIAKSFSKTIIKELCE